MTSVKILVVMFLVFARTAHAQTPVIEPGAGLGFDYADSDIQTYQVTRFEASWDSGAYVTIYPLPILMADTLPGHQTYRFVPPFQTGGHTVSVRACRTEGCGSSLGPFSFAFVTPNPLKPKNIRALPI